MMRTCIDLCVCVCVCACSIHRPVGEYCMHKINMKEYPCIICDNFFGGGIKKNLGFTVDCTVVGVVLFLFVYCTCRYMYVHDMGI